MKKFFISILILLTISIGAIVFITTNDAFLNTAAKELQTKFVKDLNIDWEKLKISSKATSLTKRDISIKMLESCIEYIESKFCFNVLNISVAINLLNPLDVKINNLNVDMTDSYYKAQKIKDAPPLALDINELLKSINFYLSLIKDYEPKDFSIKINTLQIREDQKLVTKIDKEEITVSYIQNNTQLKISLLKITNGFSGDLSYLTNNFTLKSNLLIKTEENLSITTINSYLSPQLKSPLNFELKTSISDKYFKLNLNNVTAKFDQKISLSSAECFINHQYSKNIDLKCEDINLDIKKKFSLLAKLQLDLTTNIDFSKKSELAQINLVAENSNKDILKFLLQTNLTVKNNTGTLNYEIKSFNWKLYTDQFKKLVELLKGSEFSIPAPINTMKGSIDLFSEKLVDLNDNFIKIPFKGRINLADPKKNILDFDIDSSFYYSTKSKPRLDGEISITQININIPPIDPLGGIPNMTSSSRINKKIAFKEPVKKSSLIYDIKVKSKSNDSLKLYYYLLDPYFAFSVDARLKNNYISYKIKADKNFDINYLKRSITFDKMTLQTLADDDSSLDAEFNYNISGYKIILKVIGTVESPKLILKSYPSLPREDIISLLIFKRKSTTITANQKQSVGGTEAAIADQALSLFSILAFASTPIDYVSYNPEQKTYSASISLPGNTSFQIGTNWESINNLTLRKQLSDTWAIETSYNPNDENAKQNLMLQKEINF